MSTLQFDPGLHRSFPELGEHAGRCIEMPQQALGHYELIAVDVARQPWTFVAALIAVHLRSAERGAFAADAAEAQVEMVARQDDLVRRSCGIATDQDAQRVDARPTREELLGNAIAAVLGQPRIHQVRQDLPLTAAEPEEDVPAAAHDAAIVILAERMIVGDARVGALLRVERGKQPPCERVHPIERRARPRRHDLIAAREADPSQHAESGAELERRASIHPGRPESGHAVSLSERP